MKPAEFPFWDLCRFYDRMAAAPTKQRHKVFANFRDQVIPERDPEAWQIYRSVLSACADRHASACLDFLADPSLSRPAGCCCQRQGMHACLPAVLFAAAALALGAERCNPARRRRMKPAATTGVYTTWREVFSSPDLDILGVSNLALLRSLCMLHTA